MSHYYVLNGKPRIPWISTPLGLQRCFVLSIVPGGHVVRVDVLNVTVGSDVVVAGVFVLRCYGLWGFGAMRILVDDAEFSTIVFAYTVGPYVLFVLLLLPLVLLAMCEVLARRYRRVRRR